jgi:hypothetical protein
MIKKIKRLLRFVSESYLKIKEVHEYLNNDLKSPKVNLGQIQAKLNNEKPKISRLSEVEFQVFSQWGDDGIIQYMISKLDIPNKVFIEFGVENYRESNTRFLLINNNWSGLVIDGSKDNINYIKNDLVSWAYDLHATHSFITKENINSLLNDFLKKDYPKEIGILSIDIDGNDYWVWNEINVVNPIIVIAEYNAVLGKEKAWTIPYESDFYRLSKHASYQYWGASLKCFCHLAESKGYYFVGCNSNGNNAYFIRKDKIAQFKPLTCEEGFVDSKFREFIDGNGERVGGKRRLELIRGTTMYNVETKNEEVV